MRGVCARAKARARVPIYDHIADSTTICIPLPRGDRIATCPLIPHTNAAATLPLLLDPTQMVILLPPTTTLAQVRGN